MSSFLNDVRIGFRGLLKRPTTTLVMVATLAVALGANAAVFSLIDALIIRPLTFEESDRLVLVGQFSPDEPIQQATQSVAPANYLDWRGSADALTSLVATDDFSANLTRGELPERVQGFRVTPGYFGTLGVPLQGRDFAEDEERVGRDRVAVVGDALWARRFGRDPELLGSSLTIDGEAYSVVGIAPPGFAFPMGAEIWVPLAFDAEEAAIRDRSYLTVIGRLAPGRTHEEAQAQIATIHERLRAEHPEAVGRDVVRVLTLAEGVRDIGVGPFLAVWQFSAVLVLLIACVNLANLLLARGQDRQRELAVRLALGAGRGRVLRQLLTESITVALLGAVAALPLAWLAAGRLRSALPASIAHFVVGWERIGVSGGVLAFTAGLALLAAIVFGGLPALVATRPALAQVLRDGGRGSSEGRRRQRGRNALVVAEVALALALLVASGLSTRAALNLLDGPQGYEPQGLMTLQTTLAESRYAESDARRRFVRELLGRAEELPGVTHAAVVNVLPATGSNTSRSVRVEGAPEVPSADRPYAQWRSVSPDYFATLQLPLLEGRAPSDADGPEASPVVVVSRAFADEHWPGASALGQRLRLGDDDTWWTVAGVSGDVIHHWFGSRNRPTVFVPQSQAPTSSLALAVRVDGDPAGLRDALRRAAATVDPEQPVFDVKTQREWLSDITIGLRFAAAIMSALGLIALVLAVTGVYGLMAYRVSQRLGEIGVRMALGASARQILSLTLSQAGWLTGTGIVIGLGLALALARLMEGAFMGVLAIEPLQFVAFAALLALAGMLAAWVPARRALRVDPIVVLRVE